MPPSIQAAYQGTAAAFLASLANEPVLILAALITVYLVLGVLYESYIHPLTILSTLPSAGVGALLALMICKHDFSVIALIGIVLLIGIVKKNAHHDDRFRPGGGAQGGHEAGRRHLSGLPAALPSHHDDHHGGAAGRGTAGAWDRHGSELRRPLGITMIGGLLISQLLTLYTTPVIYIWFDRLAQRFSRQTETSASLPARNRFRPS